MTSKYNNWKVKDKVWLTLAVTIVIAISVITKSTYEQSIASVCGVVYVILIARQEKLAYLFGIINVAIYGVLLWQGGLYGSSLYNLIYTVPFLIYGYFAWKKMQSENKENVVKCLNKKHSIVISVIAVLSVAIYSIIAYGFGVSYYIVDAITVCVGAIGTYLMTNKYIEQWYAWLIVNGVSLIYWIYSSISDLHNAPLAVMWLIYVINSSMGLISWKKVLK